MDKICLDKTVRTTRDIMNEEMSIPEGIRVEKVLGGMNTFRVGYSPIKLPIEHIGFATLALESARDSFSMKVKNEKGNEYRTFELVRHDEGHYIANFLQNVNADSLNWYQDKDGEQLKMSYVSSQVMRPDLTRYTQTKAQNEQGEDLRETVLREAYKTALGEYVETYLELTEAPNNQYVQEGVVEFVNEENAVFENALLELKEQSLQTIPNSTQETQQ